ncbi:glycosyltransferase family 4 protein [Dyella sp. LX-66]|uniref:glycosyltransferase family 4 protein n=1 Tax=unclassified Dyella TaxID=2634549 RepID=UPI001BE07B2C|nr:MULTISPECIES: glycosyltransferase family 4 protein [unclassified Dyella]MBT2118812.1 glycosyltransferase family 4 protein [Dyella sp. LX-1]MBT2141161.1 glycosyltransferase family 4 protein [Dyella sp. LX-66]
MRLLVLSKRQYTGKDLLDDRYGRLYELPVELAARGHEVAVLAASYRPRDEFRGMEAGVSWQSVNAWRSPLAYWRRLQELVRDFRPEAIWASSDAFHVIGVAEVGRRWCIPTVADFYDDYEAFGLASLPGVHRALRRAAVRVNAISAVSHSLAATLHSRASIAAPVQVVENGVPEIFTRAIDRDEARQRLGLPQEIPLIGTAGALSASRGIGDLLQAYRILREQVPAARLVVAGPRDRALWKDLAENALDLGELAHVQVPLLYAALDVGVVCNKDSAFGRACYPQKLAEMVAGELPVVVSAVGDAALLLQGYPTCLYAPGDAEGLARRLEQQLRSPLVVPSSLALSWKTLAIKLENVLLKAIQSAGDVSPS